MNQKLSYTESEQAWFINRRAVIELLKNVVKIGPNGRMYESTVKQAQLLLRSFGEDKE